MEGGLAFQGDSHSFHSGIHLLSFHRNHMSQNEHSTSKLWAPYVWTLDSSHVEIYQKASIIITLNTQQRDHDVHNRSSTHDA